MKKTLWLALRGYRFDNLVPAQLTDRIAAAFGGTDPSTRAFAAKIARKHGWTTAYAVRSIAEYKKFVYLGMIADFPVTPPKPIDVVWHEHLLFSRGYRDFCNQVLGRPFDHNPELVPDDRQTAAFQAQYDATLALYEREFNAPAPEAFWGTPKFAAPRDARRAPARRRAATGEMSHASSGDGDLPLYMYFGGSDSSGDDSPFGDGGGFSGGGGGDSWSDDAPDSGASDGGSGDGGSDGGSGCSSGCSSD